MLDVSSSLIWVHKLFARVINIPGRRQKKVNTSDERVEEYIYIVIAFR